MGGGSRRHTRPSVAGGPRWRSRAAVPPPARPSLSPASLPPWTSLSLCGAQGPPSPPPAGLMGHAGLFPPCPRAAPADQPGPAPGPDPRHLEGLEAPSTRPPQSCPETPRAAGRASLLTRLTSAFFRAGRTLCPGSGVQAPAEGRMPWLPGLWGAKCRARGRPAVGSCVPRLDLTSRRLSCSW